MKIQNRIAEFLPAAWRPRRELGLGRPSKESLAQSVERFVGENPGASLAAAFALGVMVAWWIKRK
jgi:hypothetical protein